MTAEDWEESDKALTETSKRGKSYREPEGRTAKRATLKKVMEEIEARSQVSERGAAGGNTVGVAGTSITEEGGENPEAIPISSTGPSEEEPAQKKRRVMKGKQPAREVSVETAASPSMAISETDWKKLNDKVSYDAQRDRVLIDASKDWFPKKSCPKGVAQSMGLALISRHLENKLKRSSIESLQDQLARNGAEAWSIGRFFGNKLERERKVIKGLDQKIAESAKLIADLEKKNKALAYSVAEKDKQIAQSKADLEKSQEIAAKGHEEFQEKEQAYQKKLEKFRARNKKLRSRVASQGKEIAMSIQGGIGLCLDFLSEKNAISSEWSDAKKVEEQILANAEIDPKQIDEGEDMGSEEDSDVASTTND